MSFPATCNFGRMRIHGYCSSRLKNGLKDLRIIRQMMNHFSALSSSSSPLLESLNPVLPSPASWTKKREFARLLKQSASDDPLSYYKTVHGKIFVSGLESDTFLSNILLNLYSRTDGIDYVCKLFGKMSERNLVTWSTMVSAYTRHGFLEEALVVFLQFWRSKKVGPNEYILASVIRACSQLDGNGRSMAFQMHCFLVKSGFDQDVYVATSLIGFYVKDEDIDAASLIFRALPEKTTATWTTLMSGLVKSGLSEVSLVLFHQMRETDIVPDGYVLSAVLSACSMLEFVEGGKQIHAYIIRRGHDRDLSVTNVLIDFYVKCARVKTARKLFDRMVVKSVVSWTTMLSGYMQNSVDKEAMELFSKMSKFGVNPDMFACSSVLTSCGTLQAMEQGRQVHAYTIKANLETDSYVRNGLIDMYAKCDSLIDARKVFDLVTEHHVVSFNAMIEGYSRQGELSKVLYLFRDMRFRLIQPSLLTFVSLLGVSASLSTLELCKQIHGLMFKYGVCLDIFASSALIDVYSKCFCIQHSRLVFEEMTEKDIVVWNAMFSGYVLQSMNEEALNLYSKLQVSRERPDEFTFAALVTAASNLTSLRLGQEFHCQLIKIGLESNPYLTNALLDMYAKCGSLKEAHETFSSAASGDVVCWNSIISSYANHGEAEKALQLYGRMMEEGIRPNYITFVGILSACSHAGVVEDGLKCFESMIQLGIEPGTEHYACIVSLLGRAGKLNEAMEFIDKMPIKPAAVVWRSLLSACMIAGNVELAQHAAEMAISTDPTDSGSFVLLSNIYASKGMWIDVKKVREQMKSDGVVKEPGRSWIEIDNEVHVFLSKEKDHCKVNQIYRALDDLIVQIKGTSNLFDTTLFSLNG